MRKRYRVLLIAAVVAAFIVPVGYALSLESQPQPSSAVLARAALTNTASAAVVAAPVIIHAAASGAPTAAPLPGSRVVPDAGKLLLVGTVLFGLSALVRKAI